MNNSTNTNDQKDKIQAILFKKEEETIRKDLAHYQKQISYFASKRNKNFERKDIHRAKKVHKKVVEISKEALEVK